MLTLADPRDVYASPAAAPSVPIHLVGDRNPMEALAHLTLGQRRWLETQRFNGAAKKAVLVPAADGGLAAVVLGIGSGSGDPCGPAGLLVGGLASTLPPGTYHLAGSRADSALAAVAWGLGAYKFRRYKTNGQSAEPGPRLQLEDAQHAATLATVEAVWMGRDLINTPAEDMSPADLEAAARSLAERHGAKVTSIVGDALLSERFPMIHAVGRASTRPPRLIDLRWQKAGGRSDAPRVTLVGKGITFDTGGLDIKPASSMLLMKKDMGGAATALALGHMIMSAGLDVRLRVLIPTADNAIAGNAFRPGDVLHSRSGKTVEIGNTDAEGRLVLADALTLADEEAPDTLVTFSTLTGAARVALGPDLPAMYATSDAFAADIRTHGDMVGDPVWQMPFWPGYERSLDSEVADLNHISDMPFAGSITAALFLKRFVQRAGRFAHFDIFAWRPSARALGPKGGEVQVARALMAVLGAAQKAS
jgi:leucyl aminopeptidase